MKELAWFIGYGILTIVVMAFYHVTTRREREWMMWQVITAVLIITVPAFIWFELLPALQSWLSLH